MRATVPAECGRCEDIAFLIEVGCGIDEIAERTRSRRAPDVCHPRERRESLRRHLRLHHRTDLLNALNNRQRKAAA